MEACNWRGKAFIQNAPDLELDSGLGRESMEGKE